MKRAVLLLVVACQACQASGSDDDYPIRPGGGGGPVAEGSGGGGVDAGVDDGGVVDSDGGVALTGKVCLLVDLRRLTLCDDRNARGLTVTLGTRTATTTDNGAFTITAPRGSGFTWRVTSSVRDRLVTSLTPFGTDNIIPAIETETYRSLLSSNQLLLGDQEGSVVMRVLSGTTRVSALQIDPDRPVLYDGADADTWDTTQTQTGPLGVVWFPGVSLTFNPATITLIPQGGTAVTTTATIENQAITFLTQDLQ
jgi:hypothetical protein